MGNQESQIEGAQAKGCEDKDNSVPLTVDLSSNNSTSWAEPNRQFQERNLSNSPIKQLSGEWDFKNNSKIIHGFGPSGLAPLTPLNNQNEKTIPIMISWSQPGKVVYVTGSFNSWEKKNRLQKSNGEFITVVDMPIGKHVLLFIVDDELKWTDNLPLIRDSKGNLVNFIEVLDEEGNGVNDGLQELSNELELAVRPESPEESYDCAVPLLRSDSGMKPPLVPAHLKKVFLDVETANQIDPDQLLAPSHSIVNHMSCTVKDGTATVSLTWRFREKVR